MIDERVSRETLTSARDRYRRTERQIDRQTSDDFFFRTTWTQSKNWCSPATENRRSFETDRGRQTDRHTDKHTAKEKERDDAELKLSSFQNFLSQSEGILWLNLRKCRQNRTLSSDVCTSHWHLKLRTWSRTSSPPSFSLGFPKTIAVPPETQWSGGELLRSDSWKERERIN